MSSESNVVVGIIGAMPAEIKKLGELVVTEQETKHGVGGTLTFIQGYYIKKSDGTRVRVVYVSSNVGLVFASSVCTSLIEKYKATCVVFTGVAGGLLPEQRVGDVVIATDVVNYDMDCTNFILPFAPDFRHSRGQLPFLNWTEFVCDGRLGSLAQEAAEQEEVKSSFQGAVSRGRVVSGSEFLTTKRKAALAEVWAATGNPACVEMEGAAVGQICKLYGIPFLLIRALSDTLEGDASDDFNAFCDSVAEHTAPMLIHILEHS
jgi:adenosylhomocysteine nucleosidase